MGFWIWTATIQVLRYIATPLSTIVYESKVVSHLPRLLVDICLRISTIVSYIELIQRESTDTRDTNPLG